MKIASESTFRGPGPERPTKEGDPIQRPEDRCSLRPFQSGAAQRFADLPVVTEGIYDPPHAPTIILIGDWRNFTRSGRHGLRKYIIGIVDCEDHARRRPTQRL